MSRLYVGDPVVFIGSWNTFLGQRGIVKAVDPLMVRVEGDTHPMRFSDHEVARVTDDEVNMTGAE